MACIGAKYSMDWWGRKRVLVQVLKTPLDSFGVPNSLDDPFL